MKPTTPTDVIIAKRNASHKAAAESAWAIVHRELDAMGIRHRLFGSLKNGGFASHSDIDVLVFSGPTKTERAMIARLTCAVHKQFRVSFDVVFEDDLPDTIRVDDITEIQPREDCELSVSSSEHRIFPRTMDHVEPNQYIQIVKQSGAQTTLEFNLPPAIADLVRARNAVRDHYQRLLQQRKYSASLHFTLDGNLVGDIGEALAVELFGIELVNAKSTEGIDGVHPKTGRTVQVKATGTRRGPAFRDTKTHADDLLFFELDLENSKGTVIYNGPEHYARSFLKNGFSGQRSLSAAQIRRAAQMIKPDEALPFLPKASP